MGNVVYIHSPALSRAADALPSNLGRAGLVHELIDALDLLEGDYGPNNTAGSRRAKVIHPMPATREELLRFHDGRFLDQLLELEAGSSDDGSSDEPDCSGNFNLRREDECRPSKRSKVETFGLEDDCPVFDLLPEYVAEVGGASIQAARELRDGRASVAIAWTGGRHHGKRGQAAGFCYVQDIVLAILELRLPPEHPTKPTLPTIFNEAESPSPPPDLPTKIRRVLYIDLDLHHGDGVEHALSSTPHVLTLSAHLHGPGFFPASGSLDSTGPASSPASFHALNLALEPGLSTPVLLRLFESCIEPTMEAFRPDAVVVQCGCDGLAGDPCKEWNLDLEGMGEVVRRIIGWKMKTLLLGGGGYNNANVARCWAYLTSVALGNPLALDTPIPASVDDYAAFGPSFSLDVPAGALREKNTEESVAKVEVAFRQYIATLESRYKDR
ncbi:hypothetical protein P7C70_g8393, partial [Phenoliferia sp. Uapishka_3]